jgi:beta-lactam-binding protein with PASTA domain
VALESFNIRPAFFLLLFKRARMPSPIVSIRSARSLLPLLLLLLGACGGGSSDTTTTPSPMPDVAVPDVVSQNEAAARTAISGAGLTVGTVSNQSSDTVPAGDVISQAPAAGAMVAAGRSVNLVVSSGPANIAVPNTVGETRAAAGAAITGAGLSVGTVSEQASNTVPAGNVITQSPAAGTLVAAGTDVDLVVSLGPATIAAPNVVGLSQLDATTAITTAGLLVGTISQQNDNVVPAGDVISQDPAASTLVAPGSAVNLTVSLGPANVAVPDVVGQAQGAARTAITGAGLLVGTINLQNDNTVPAGAIISQSPAAGTLVGLGAVINLVESLGPPDVAVPNVAGQTQAVAENAITSAGLVVGTVTSQNDNVVPAGSVISQDPTAGTLVGPGSTVNLVVSLGPPDVTVPNVTGITQVAAEAAITSAGLSVGAVSQQNDNVLPAGSVISQLPAAGTLVAAGSPVSLVVSLGPPDVAVPNVTGQTQSAAENAITSAGLAVGTVTQRNDNAVPAGNVISQDPTAGTLVGAGSAVNLVVSLGSASVTVPNVVGQTQSAAENAITSAGLTVGTISQQNDNSVPAGNVISQNPTAGSSVGAGSAVDLVLSLGPATVAVPNVVGQTQAAAQNAITSAGLMVGTVSQQNDNTVPAGNVISQNPTAGTLVGTGSTVNLVVSLGPASVSVPGVVGQTQGAAESAITSVGLVVGTVTQQNDNSVPAGNVISQSPTAGTLVSAGSAVNLVVSLGPADVAVPDVTGLSQAAAENAITTAGLAVGTVTQQNSNTVPAGNVISQNPAAGSLVAPGSGVSFVVSLGPATTAVPDVVGLTLAAAESAITGAGLVVGTVSQQNDNSVPAGNVISQNPVAATLVAPGSAVSLVVSLGPATGGGFSDEFNTNSLSDWSLRHQVEGTAAQYSVLDINQSRPGFLSIVPNQTPGWFAGGDAPLIFKTLSGNFAVHTRVLADSVSSPGQAPGSNFNSAGLMARNASGASGPENYIMLNIGRQNNATGAGSETKTTVNSNSTLFLDSGSNEGQLVLCRVGDTFYSYRFLSVDLSWILLDSFSRPDLPSSLQVGMVVNAFNAPADIRAEFDFIRLLPTPSNVNECLP